MVEGKILFSPFKTVSDDVTAFHKMQISQFSKVTKVIHYTIFNTKIANIVSILVTEVFTSIGKELHFKDIQGNQSGYDYVNIGSCIP